MDFYENKVLCLDDEGQTIHIQGLKMKFSLCFIPMMKYKQCLRQGCQLYIIEVVSDNKEPSLNSNHLLYEFKDVFPKEFPRLPPEREINSTIELKPGVEPISKSPYKMTTPELREL